MVIANGADVGCKAGESADLCKLRKIASPAKVFNKQIAGDEEKKFQLIKNNTEFVVITPRSKRSKKNNRKKVIIVNEDFGLSGTYSVY